MFLNVFNRMIDNTYSDYINTHTIIKKSQKIEDNVTKQLTLKTPLINSKNYII